MLTITPSDAHRASYAVFGRTWHSTIPLPSFFQLKIERPADTLVRLAHDAIVERRVLDRSGNVAFCTDGFRHHASDGATVDVYRDRRIVVTPQAGWTGSLSPSFFGTVTALTLALDPCVPIHASAVEVNGRAIVIFGRSGAGKSSFAAMLIAEGGRLISDDLTVIADAAVTRGRQSIRLYPPAAVPDWPTEGQPDEDGKISYLPPRIEHDDPVPIAHLVLLDTDTRAVPDRMAADMIGFLTFRQKLLAQLPGHDWRMRALRDLVRHRPLQRIADLSDRDLVAGRRRAATMLRAFAANEVE